MKDPNSELGLFTFKRFGAREGIGHQYGALFYDNLSFRSTKSPSVYNEGMRAVPVSHFMEFAVPIETPCRRNIWIYPDPFWSMCMINESLFTPYDPGRPTGAEMKENTNLYTRKNAEFVDGSKERTEIADYRNHSIVCIRDKENITESTELYVSSCNYY